MCPGLARKSTQAVHVCLAACAAPHARAAPTPRPRANTSVYFKVCLVCNALRIMQTYRQQMPNGDSCKPCRHAMHPAAGQAITSHNMQPVNLELAESNSGTRALCRSGEHAAAVSRLPAAGQACRKRFTGCKCMVHTPQVASAERLRTCAVQVLPCRRTNRAQAMPHCLPKRWEIATAYRVGR